MNKLILMGNLTKDPEIKKTTSEHTYAKFTVAVRENKEKTVFIPCIAWDKKAELLESYFKKGNKILVEGRLSIDNYTDNQGTTKTQVTCVCDQIYFCSNKAENSTPTTGVDCLPS